MDLPVKFCDSISNGSRDNSSEAVGCGIFDRFLNFDNCQPQVVSSVISGVVVDLTDLKVPVKFCGSRPNCSRDIRLPHFVRTRTTTTPPAYAGHHIIKVITTMVIRPLDDPT